MRSSSSIFLIATSLLAFVIATMVHAQEENVLTPKRMIESHQLASLSVSPAGTRAVVGVKRYSFEKDTTSQALYLVDVPSFVSGGSASSNGAKSTKIAVDKEKPALLSAKASEALWLSDEDVLYLDNRTLYAKHISVATSHANASHHNVHFTDLFKSLGIRINEHGKYIGAFPTEPTTLRLAPGKNDGEATLVFSAEVYADGDLTKVAEHDESEAVKQWDDVRVYDSLMVRHWDRWIYPGKRSQLFAVDLKRHGQSWSLASPFRNLLYNTTLESPVKPFGDAGDYHLSQTHVTFVARDPSVQAAWHTKHNVYVVPLDGSAPPKVVQEGDHGASASPAFSPNGNHVVWLQMYKDGYEADRNRITLAHVTTGSVVTIVPDWQYSPSSIQFAKDGKSLVGTVEKEGQTRLFTIALHRNGSDDNDAITTLTEHHVEFQTEEGVITNVEYASGANEYVIAASTLRGPPEVYLVSLNAPQKDATLLNSAVVQLTDFAHAKQSPLANVELGPVPEHLTYPGAGGRDSYVWLIKPPGYDESQKAHYPLLVLVHGGPESAFTNSWSRRWNPLTFASQGFVTIAINPAGSTGYGQKYTEEIIGQLGGAPFEDVVLATKYILNKLDSIDAQRVVAAGGSYGGYMMNWIQGHNDEGLFKGLVSHDSVFSMQGMYFATDELYFPEHEAGGPIYEIKVREQFTKWSPEQYTHKWSTPMLIIHGGRDYRLTEAESLSCFNVLQRRGIDSRLIYYPQENHWVLKPKNSLKWNEELIAWSKKYSKGSNVASEINPEVKAASEPEAEAKPKPFTIQHSA